MIAAAEAGEFDGLESLKDWGWTKKSSVHTEPTDSEKDSASDGSRETTGPTKGELFVPAIYTQRWGMNGSKRATTKRIGTNGEVSVAQSSHSQNASLNETADEQSGFEDSERSHFIFKTIRDLMNRHRVIEAGEMFLETHPPTLTTISMEQRELALEIFYANCQRGNIFVARCIFERIEAVDRVSPRMWKVLLMALAKNGSVESASQLYMKYRNSFELPPIMIDVILRCLLESQRFRVAKWLMYASIKHDRNCGLCGLFLAALWRKTRSIDLINEQFEKLLSILPRFEKKPTEKLFNPVLKAYVEFGRVADAEALANDMQTKYQVPVSCRTKGLLLFSSALACDWNAVENGLQEMHDLGLTHNMDDFVRIFDRMFLEYWPSHSATDIRSFFFGAVEKYSLVPDRVLYQHALEALVEKGNMDHLAELSNLVKSRGWELEFDEDEFLEMLRSRRLARERSPTGSWQTLQAARVKYGQVASSQQILGYDQRSVPIAQVNRMPRTQEPLPWYERTMEDILPSRPIDQYQPLDKQMGHYLHSGNIKGALEAFQNAKAAGLQFKPIHVELAVIATLVDVGLNAARALIEEEWEGIRHFQLFFPRFFRQVTEIEPPAEVEIIKMAVFRFYNLCWENPLLIVKHNFMISMTSQLIKKRQYNDALDLLLTAYKSRWGRHVKFNGICMKMFVRAFLATDNLKGVRWCILTGIARGSACNKEFLVEVRRAVASLRLRSPQDTRDRMRKRTAYLIYLNFLADILEKKCDGDADMRTLRSNRSEKRMSRRLHEQPVTSERPRCDFASVRRAVESWDEELELDKLTSKTNLNARAVVVLEMWDERNVVEEGDEYYAD
jgi:hypothetical protein